MTLMRETKHQARILIAEDSRTQAARLAALLEDHGYTAEVAPDGNKALQAARASRPALVISDVVMPELDGYGLCRALKDDETLKDIPVVLVTTLANAMDVVRGLECGADNFIRKPYEARYLLARIEYLLMNVELRKGQRVQTGLEVNLGGRRQFITAERQQILDLLISTYEQAVELNGVLARRERELSRSSVMLQGLYRIADGLNAVVSERQVAETVLDRTLELPGVQAGWLVVRAGGDAFRVLASRNIPPVLAESGALEGLCTCRRQLLAGELKRGCEIVECERLKHAYGEGGNFRMHACLPIRIEGQAIGILNLLGNEEGLINAEGKEHLDAIGNQLGVALGRAHLHDDLERLVEARTAKLTAEVEQRRRAEEQVRLLLAVSDVIQAAEDVPTALEGVLKTICEAIEWECGEAWLNVGGAAQAVAQWWVRNGPGEEFIAWGRGRRLRFDAEGSLIVSAWNRGEPQWIPDLKKQDAANSFMRRAEALRAGLHAALAVTMPGSGGAPLAGLLLLRREAGEPDEHMVRLIVGVVRQIGAAIERKETADRLAANETLLRRVLESLPVGVRVADGGGAIVMSNPAFGAIIGNNGERGSAQELLERSSSGGEKRVSEESPLGRAVTEAKVTLNEMLEFERSDGVSKSVLNSAVPILHVDGTVRNAVEVTEDITERRAQEQRIVRLTRMQAMLSGINSTIVRVKTREELFEAACRLIVDRGKFLFARIRMFNDDRSVLFPVASEGLDSLPFRAVAVLTEGTTLLIGQAASSGHVVVCNDLESDPDHSKLRMEGLRAGCAAFATLPVLVNEGMVGVITIGSREAGVFDAEEIRLLDELAGDVGFALDHLDKQERIDYLSFYDGLTELANRMLFHDRLRQAVSVGRSFAVGVVNIVGLRRVNEAFGAHGGDTLLKGFAHRLALCHGADLIGRVGSDSFALIGTEGEGVEPVGRWVEQLRSELARPFEIDGTELRIDVRVGVAIFPNDGRQASELIANAESALQRARKDGAPVVFYQPKFNTRVAERLMLESRLRHAVEEGQFALHYQPKVDLTSGQILGAEALLRWNDPERGLVSPAEFIPLLEESGLILEVGRWVLEEASGAYARWREAGLECPEVAVNVSQIQMRRPGFADEVVAAIAAGGGAGGISVEITETLVMDDIEDAIAKLRRIREAGVRVAIDDFGTGYSSLSYLAKLPVDVLKIDRAFVVEMPRDAASRTLVSTILTLAETFGLQIVAEGVESEEQCSLLRELGCEQAQGFLFYKPLTAEQFEQLLRDAKCGAPAASAQ